MFASGRYSVAHYLIHAMPPVSANAYMHFERNFRHGRVQLYCLTQWILTRAGHPKITSRWDGAGRNGEGTERGGTGEAGVAKSFAKGLRKACKQVVSRKGAAADN